MQSVRTPMFIKFIQFINPAIHPQGPDHGLFECGFVIMMELSEMLRSCSTFRQRWTKVGISGESRSLEAESLEPSPKVQPPSCFYSHSDIM